ncbi:helix-turn-helix domain-containing protein [Shewanella algae]|uniref:helix-turn-helix domain-containing protein n=1 Tax=Gammaproteobacteria TaxID=1236 RepID=UPI0005EBF58F|nr:MULTISPECIES: helix-turn-helix domain-containing protein [Gammaproteobacteria]MBE4048765.1 helix-turn-helix domain-containing protein [Vibrio parahaemolyticus]MBO2655028.1 helix-turn-helix domain-containing protein [Shewanella algae]MCM2529670.1 helix-turn-helix domain-containing protein [Shewanella algae]PLR59008.1 helix-turn-helix domain-containing protein [Vibrio parahaemolyticus]PWF90077.1 helix-turn-helix domain-containing protein [Shewanella algae]
MSTKPTLKANEEKWGKENVEAGWTLVPNALLVHQASLGLQPMDVNIILQIARFWWEAGKHPYPSKGTLADCIGVSPRTIQTRISALAKLGFIERIERRDSNGSKTNIYKLTPLIEHLKPYSESMIEEKVQRQTENKARPRMRGKITKKKTNEVTGNA